jgi:hypothetical protein
LQLVGTFIAALRETTFSQPISDVSATEVARYASGGLIDEDLWRLQLRAINGLVVSIELASRQEDRAAIAVLRAGRLFLGGLLSVSVSLCILIIVGGV